MLLNANVAFLAIQSVDNNGNTVYNRSPMQISSYLSMLTSIGSIIIGLLLANQTRNQDSASASDAATFIFNRMHSALGFEPLAVLHSLPYALLMWSMVFFLAAFSFMCFERSSIFTRTLVAVVWTAVATLILWCVFNSFESSDWDWLRGLSYWRRATDADDAADEDATPKDDATGEEDQAGVARRDRDGLRGLWCWRRTMDEEGPPGAARESGDRDWLRGLSCWRRATDEDDEVGVAQESSGWDRLCGWRRATDEDDQPQDAASEFQPRKRRWVWLSSILLKRSHGSEHAVANV